jgi:haloalkane dehalogenase
VDIVRTPDARFRHLPGYDFPPQYVELTDGLRMHYLDAGPSDGDTVLLLHGQPTWSYLYRKVIPPLVEAGLRVIAPDLIGFGRSDKPVRRTDHTVRAHIRWLSQSIEALDLSDITAVVQDWGGPIGLGALSALPDRFARIVAANTPLHTADESLAGVLTWACHRNAAGSIEIEPALLDYQRMTQELSTLAPSLFVQGATERDVEPGVLAAYDAPFPDETYCAGPRQLPILMGLTPQSECARCNVRTLAALKNFDGPLLTAFSDGDPSTRGWDRVLQAATPGAHGQQHVVVAGAGHFLQEDAGPELGEIIARFIADNPTTD